MLAILLAQILLANSGACFWYIKIKLALSINFGKKIIIHQRYTKIFATKMCEVKKERAPKLIHE